VKTSPSDVHMQKTTSNTWYYVNHRDSIKTDVIYWIKKIFSRLIMLQFPFSRIKHFVQLSIVKLCGQILHVVFLLSVFCLTFFSFHCIFQKFIFGREIFIKNWNAWQFFRSLPHHAFISRKKCSTAKSKCSSWYWELQSHKTNIISRCRKGINDYGQSLWKLIFTQRTKKKKYFVAQFVAITSRGGCSSCT
jgi:hypothetical protein